MKTYLVKEIFGPTIQGEGKGTGEVVLFLRFSGCNKWTGRPEDKAMSACPFCDTDFLGGDRMTANEIRRDLRLLDPLKKIQTLVISGGEPMLQLDLPLMQGLEEDGWFVYVETNGSRNVSEPVLDLLHHVSCSPKQGADQTILGRIDSMKVLHPPLTPDRHILAFFKHPKFRLKEFYIQPVMDENYQENLKECLKICYDHPEIKLSIQLHKTIEVK